MFGWCVVEVAVLVLERRVKMGWKFGGGCVEGDSG